MIRAWPTEFSRDADLLQQLYTAGTLVAALVDEELEALGVSPELYSFLGWVYALQPVTPGGLAAETGMPPTTIRDYIRRLVERGDVRKVANPADGRSYHLMLTPKGRRLAERGYPACSRRSSVSRRTSSGLPASTSPSSRS